MRPYINVYHPEMNLMLAGTPSTFDVFIYRFVSRSDRYVNQ